ncbi:CDP-alcohol phosphatidyltransferase family protein [Pseudoroseicyclus tamaricis]|uniref:CDP-alcohol phosphatidyltransferase family protein n=1 Tax=Pseudoroseicyclus tamaricis TaxID=2705421 RepID=A0A6B2K059_9RHOB|nr:CDP-alcohol phosphatidyltransferase family protein [Pseudoroseicyclus tamaricis]NDU99705.1 CDP-alcohol phosphatidyltransferase family protein [Pseudoroseicyclus tamaricis]
MFDASLRRLIDPPLNRAGRRFARAGWSADAMTAAGLALGLLCAALIALGLEALALLPFALRCLADGLDGAIARAGRKTDFGGYFDISADFLFYGAVPLAFVLAEPVERGVAGAFLLASFYFNGATFLGFAVLAERRGMETSAQGEKTLYYSNGLLEGGETLVFFALLMLLPDAFSPLAWLFGAACFLTGTLRLIAARRLFRG